jgi:RNA polymerase sigma-70 factor (ECF subfamily)
MEIHERFAQHRDRVRCYLLGRVRDAHVADDLTQETLVRAITYADGLRDPDAAVAWLLRIAWHVSLDWGRRRVRRRECGAEALCDSADRVQEATTLELDEARAVYERWRRRLRRALAQLAALDRVLVIGHYFVGLSCGELAARAKISRDVVKMRLCRARRRMRATLPDGWLEDWEATTGLAASG